ncbi:hypothetical protein [Aliagarivorans marinus]|uniref:hypothetical protein n=1 Tax=Aliagarivorans marinus TaxID=561965 RepID=UPI000401D52C|nr:hypothetical protein [Aliagarivorans marinus]
MDQTKARTGMRCIYDHGYAVIDRIDKINRLAIIRDQHTGEFHTRSMNELFPDDEQYHYRHDQYY